MVACSGSAQGVADSSDGRGGHQRSESRRRELEGDSHARRASLTKTCDIAYDHLTSYEDGSSKFDDVVVTTTRANGRKFTISAKEANVGKSESQYRPRRATSASMSATA